MIGVIADDITGANDIGSMFAKNHYVSDVYDHEHVALAAQRTSRSAPDVLILDTDSRFDDKNTAYNKVFRATMKAVEAGADRFINKTCSVFRGNIGAEFDAMLDALNESFAVVVLGFPKNGRITREGIHYVNGVKLEQSEFRDDPVHPMMCSNLQEILQSQTERTVGAIHHEVVRQGPSHLRERLERAKQSWHYVIVDVTCQEDLRVVAEAVKDVRVLCGSSAIAEELPAVLGTRPESFYDLPPENECGLLCAAGSLMPQTARQIEYMREKRVFVYELDTAALVKDNDCRKTIETCVKVLSEQMRNGDDVVVHTSNLPHQVNRTREAGAKQGFSKKQVSQRISRQLAEVVDRLVKATGQNRLVIAGGDTSAAVCRQLGVYGMRVYREIEPGLPSCLTFSIPERLLVLKSGSFGKPDFFEKAFAHMKTKEKGGVS
ncbi:MAG TPA: four-carbon acid sugar kinase family protein [Bacillales bacterium]|nr:four-carbon acid sugar kinase family protein [Bacillales bacterium]